MLAVAQSLAMLFAARVIDGLSGGNITTARAYIADVTEPDERAKAFGFLGAAFGLGFIVGPGLAGLFAHISYTAPIWAAAAVTMVATAMAWFWLPETVHRGSAVSVSPWRALPEVLSRPHLRPLLLADFLYWCSFAVCTTTFALFASRRFGFDVPTPATCSRASVCSVSSCRRAWSASLPADWRAPDVAGWASSLPLRVGRSSPCPAPCRCFSLSLIPAGIGVGLCNASIVTLVSHSGSKEEQGTVQGAAGALESLGRAIGPVWGHGALQRFGEGSCVCDAQRSHFSQRRCSCLSYQRRRTGTT